MRLSGRNKSMWHQVVHHRQIYLMLLIPVAFTALFCYYPMFGVQVAFKNFSPIKGIWGSEWVGFTHFKTFFSSFYFERVMTNTLKIALYSLVISFPLNIIFALFLNIVSNIKFKKLIQTVTYMPYFISTVVLVGMMFQMFSSYSGLYGGIYKLLYDGKIAPNLFANPDSFIHFYVWSGIWQSLGWGSIIYIAALSGVDIQLHEAARIDGASRLKRIIHIDLPAILPTASILLILSFGDIMNVGFEKVYAMQNNLNLKNSEIIATYVYKVGMSSGGGNFSYASAIGLFNSVINCTLLVIVNAISRKINSDGESLW